MKVAFYKGKGDIVDLAIRKWTFSEYSHCEIVIGNTWYSSSGRDGGVRKKQIEPKPENWDFIDIKLPRKDINNIKKFFELQLGKKYDYVGIFLSQVLPLGIDEKNKWFCSEICSKALQNVGYLNGEKHPSWYSPGRLFNALNTLNTLNT